MDRTVVLAEVRDLLVSGLRLDVQPADIASDAAIFGDGLGGDGLGLDSIDALELVVLVEERFHVSIPDEDVGQRAFASVGSLVDFILAERRAG